MHTSLKNISIFIFSHSLKTPSGLIFGDFRRLVEGIWCFILVQAGDGGDYLDRLGQIGF